MMLDIFSYSSCGFDYVWHQQCIYGWSKSWSNSFIEVLVLWVDPCKDTQEILLAMSSTPKTASHAESSPAPQPLSTPSSCRPPSSSPPSSAKALPAATTESVEGGNPMAEGDKDLLIKALAKIEELESRLESASNTSTRGKDDEKNEEEKDDDPIVTPDGQKVPFLKIFLGCPQKSELYCITTKGRNIPYIILIYMDLQWFTYIKCVCIYIYMSWTFCNNDPGVLESVSFMYIYIYDISIYTWPMDTLGSFFRWKDTHWI